MLALPYIDIVLKSIYVIGKIVGTLTRIIY